MASSFRIPTRAPRSLGQERKGFPTAPRRSLKSRAVRKGPPPRKSSLNDDFASSGAKPRAFGGRWIGWGVTGSGGGAALAPAGPYAGFGESQPADYGRSAETGALAVYNLGKSYSG